ncbi:MAG: peptidylprolyl isomerase [Chthoniobacteraceae bacterium]
MSHKVISFHYTLSDCDGVVLESSKDREAVSFMSGMGMIVPGLEREIINYAAGQTGRVEVKAEDGYGLIDFSKFIQVPRESLPKQEIKEGDLFQSNKSPMPFTVKQITDTHVVLDGNHPLAGEDLSFDVEVIDIREASEQELAQLQEMMAKAEAQAQAQAQGEAPAQPAAPDQPQA